MPGICGWLGQLEPGESPVQVLNRMASGLPSIGPPLYDLESSNRAGLLVNTGHFYSDDDLWVAVEGDVFSLRGEIADLSRSGNPAIILAAAYRRHSDSFLQYLHGPFSLAILDFREMKALLAVDRMCVRPFYYASSNDGFVFATTTRSLLSHPAARSDLDHQAIFDYLYFGIVPSPYTIYQQQSKVLPGQFVSYYRNNVKTDSYWKPTFQKDTDSSLEALSARLSHLLKTALLRCFPDQHTGAFLSGGLDSSTITGILAEVTNHAASAYSIGFDIQGYNEIEYARITAKHFRTKHTVYFVTPQDVVDAIPSIARFCDEPFGNPSAVAVYYCARAAVEDGMNLLLAGDGGDELFAGNVRYARQALFERYYLIPPAVRGVMDHLIFGLPFGRSLLPIRKAIRYIEQANIPLPERLQTYNFLYSVPPDEVFDPDFLASINASQPLLSLKEVYKYTDGQKTLDRLLHLDWKFTLADNDLRKVSKMCELAGIAVRYPLLDDELVDFSTQLRTDVKLKGLKLRYFFKHAMRAFLPREVLAKPKRGFALPFGVWLSGSRDLQDLAYGSLQDLKSRRYLRADFIDRLIEGHKTKGSSTGERGMWDLILSRLIEQGKTPKAASDGNMIYVLMMLELWLQSHNA